MTKNNNGNSHHRRNDDDNNLLTIHDDDNIDGNISTMGEVGGSARDGYRVYPKRWIMLLYLSTLNLLSDWTGLSVAPISTITIWAYNSNDDYIYAKDNDIQRYIQPEALVTCFLVASSVGTALEPWILGRLGLRRTIVLGAFCNMVGNLVKSGGLPPILHFTNWHHGMPGTYTLYIGFFFVGFANPLFQCTPALLSAAWFPNNERTLATSIMLNSNQLGVGLAFIVGALYVQSPSQIVNYFGLLSLFSVLAFIGTAVQLEDAPPTPPSGSSRIMRGTFEVSVRDILHRASSSLLVVNDGVGVGVGGNEDRHPNAAKYDFISNSSSSTRQRKNTDDKINTRWNKESDSSKIGASSASVNASARSLLRRHVSSQYNNQSPIAASRIMSSPAHDSSNDQQLLLGSPYTIIDDLSSSSYYDSEYYYDGAEPTITQTPHHLNIDIRDDQVFRAARACFARKGFSHCLIMFTCVGIIINVLSTYLDYLVRGDYNNNMQEEQQQSEEEEEGNNNISTASIYVAIIGALFQLIIMISSIFIGTITDRSRSYFVITLILAILSVIALAECGVSLDEHRAGNVRWSLLVVSGCLGPLLPITAELAVESVYPLSENTVLVILQLSCSFFSALFIPLFKFVSNVGVSVTTAATTTTAADETTSNDDGTALVLGNGRPPYTFSFYLLIVIAASSAVYFATFNGKYLRYEAEMAKKRRDVDLLFPEH
jgi:MFS family permease